MSVWLALRRGINGLVRRPGRGFRILAIGPVFKDRLPALGDFIAYVKRTHGLLTPEDAAALMDAAAGEAGKKTRRPPCLLTFDGGFSSHLEVARDVLGPLGARAIFFVCPGLMDLSGENQRAAMAANIFDGRIRARDLPPDLRLMTWDDIAVLRSAAHAVGLHGLTHRRLARLSGADLRREIVTAADGAGTHLGAPVDWFAPPFGDSESLSAAALDIIAQRFRFCRSTVPGINARGVPALALRAHALDAADPIGAWKWAIEGGLDRPFSAARARLDAMASIDAPRGEQ